jgi:hypothetical protein
MVWDWEGLGLSLIDSEAWFVVFVLGGQVQALEGRCGGADMGWKGCWVAL